jgi:hypothetical protein
MKKLFTLITVLATATLAFSATTNEGVAVRVPIPSVSVASLLVTGLAQSTNAFAATDKAVSNLVNISTTQTVAGVKTFTGQLISSNSIIGGTVTKLTNGVYISPVMTNGANYGNAFRSPGTGTLSEQFGSGAAATGEVAVALGWGSVAGDHSLSIGGAAFSGPYSTAIGSLASAESSNSISIGASAYTTAPAAIAIGKQATVEHSNSVAIGNSAASTAANQIVLGSSVQTVVAAGRLVDTTISNATFSGSIVLLTGGTITNTALIGPAITNAAIRDSSITNTAISGGTMAGTAISGGTLTNANLLGCAMSNAMVQGSVVSNTTYHGTIGLVSSGTWNGATLAGTNQFAGILALNKWDNTSLATGPNGDVNIGTNSFVRFPSGPGGAYSISGLLAGVNGQVVTLYFPLSYPVTLKNDTGTAANRIYTLAGGDVSSSGACSTTLIYDSSAARWIMVGFWRDTGQQVYGTNVVGAVSWSGNSTNALSFTGQANSATITASQTSTTTNLVQRSITGSIAGTTLRLWNDTQGKYQQITLSGSAGTEHLTVTDIP